MKRFLTMLVLTFAAPAIASAGEIFGKIVAGGAPVGEAATVAMTCGKNQYPAVKTDKSGSYHLVAKENGKCTLTVTYKDQSASLEVASYDDAVQADLVLETKEGKLTARRR